MPKCTISAARICFRKGLNTATRGEKYALGIASVKNHVDKEPHFTIWTSLFEIIGGICCRG